jgi:hypothetical protein
MSDVQLPIIDGCLYIDNSQLENFQTCSRQWQYGYVERRILDKSSATRFGSAIHKALEWRYLKPDFHAVIDGPDMEAVGLKYLADNPDLNEEWRNAEQLQIVLREYNKTYPYETFRIHEHPKKLTLAERWTHVAGDQTGFSRDLSATSQHHILDLARVPRQADKPFVERPFAIPLAVFAYRGTPVTVIYTGRIDLVTWDGPHLWIWDHKTTSIMGEAYFDGLRMSAQFLGYMWAANQLFKTKPTGYNVNILGSRAPTAKGTGKRVELARLPVYKDWSLVDEWLTNTIQLLEEVFFHANKGNFPLKKVWCVGKFGKCQYYDVCSLPTPEARRAMISSGLYKNNEWSPLNED